MGLRERACISGAETKRVLVGHNGRLSSEEKEKLL